MDKYLFDDFDSVIHAVLGFLIALFPLLGLVAWPIFVVYEVLEPENPISTVGDVVEAIVGFVYGIVVRLWLGWSL